MDVKHMLSDLAANIMLLSRTEQMRQGEYVQRVTVQQSLSAPLTVLFHAWCWITVGSEERGEQTWVLTRTRRHCIRRAGYKIAWHSTSLSEPPGSMR